MRILKHKKLPGIVTFMLILVAMAVLSMSSATTGVASNTSYGSGSPIAPPTVPDQPTDAGDLDTSFDTDGKVTTDLVVNPASNHYDVARAVAIQSDGKIVSAGVTNYQTNSYCFALTRHNTDGSLDTSFSSDGKMFYCFDYRDAGAYGVAIQPDGKIVVVGAMNTNSSPNSYFFTATRHNTDGNIDTTFSGDGWTDTCFDLVSPCVETSIAKGVAIQSDGKIVMVGSTTQGSATNFALLRLTSNGSIDNTFSGDGILTTDFFGGWDEARAVAIQPDGKIVVAGAVQVSGGNYDFAVARYTTSGTLDTSFNFDGKVNYDFYGGDDGAYALAIQPDGSIVVVGASYSSTFGYDFAVVRYLSNGTPDSNFGAHVFHFVSGTAEEIANGVALQSDGKIVVAGYSPGVGFDFALARLLSDGNMDTSFSGDGKLTTDFGGSNDVAAGVAIAPDGKIVAAGQAYMGATNTDDFALARYLHTALPTATPTRTNTPTPTNTRTHTVTVTATGTPTRTNTSTNTPTGIPTNTSTNTPTNTPTNTNTPTATSTRTYTPTNSPTRTNTPTNTPTNIPTNTNTPTPLPTQTPGGASATPVPSYTSTPTPTNSPTSTQTPTNTSTPSMTSTSSPTNTPTPLPTQTPGGASATPVPSDTPTDTPTATPSMSLSTATPTGATPTGATTTPTPTACTLQFEDVPPGHTFYAYVLCMVCRGIVSGYACGVPGEPCVPPANSPYFRPGNLVTRGQISKIVSNAAGFQEPVSGQTFEDVQVGSTFYDFIKRLVGRGVMSGYLCGGPGEPCVPPANRPYFRPGASATRGQISKIVSNAAGFQEPVSGQTFEDVPVGSAFYDYVERLVSRGVINGYPCGGTGEPCVPPANKPYFRPGANVTRGQTTKIVANTFFPGCDTPQRRH